MTLLGALARHRDPVDERSLTPGQLAWARGDDLTDGYTDTVGVRVNRDSALGLSAVWACVSLIADTIATLPLAAYTQGAGVPRRYTGPGVNWLERPNPEQTMVDFKFGTVASLLLDGNAFVYTVRDRRGDVREAWLLDPRWVQVRREFQPDGTLALNYYVMVGRGAQSPVGPFKVTAGPEMFHLMAFQPNSSWPRGLGPLDQARMMFGSGIAGQEMGGRFFGHGLNASGVIEVPDELTIEQARELKDDFARANGGIRKMHMPPVLTGGASWKQMQISPEAAQFIEQRRFSVEEIARFFRVPPHMIGDVSGSTSWGTGIEQQTIGFAKFTCRPWIERIEESWSRWMLIFQPGVFLRFDLDGLLRGDSAAQADYALKRFQTGWTHNDVRRFFGDEPITDGDVSYYPVNMAPVGGQPETVQKTPVAEDGVDQQPVARELLELALDRRAAPVTIDVHQAVDEDEERRHQERLDAARAEADRVGLALQSAMSANQRQTEKALAELAERFTGEVTRVAETISSRPVRTRRTIQFSDGREATVVEEKDSGEG